MLPPSVILLSLLLTVLDSQRSFASIAEHPSVSSPHPPSDYTTGLLHDLTGAHQGRVYSLAFSSRDVLASGATDNNVLLWGLKGAQSSGAQEREVSPLKRLKGHSGGVTALAFATVQGHEVLISGAADNTSRIWNISSGKAEKSLTHPGTVFGLAVRPYNEGERMDSEEGVQVATACWDGVVRIFSLPTGALVAELKGHTGGLYSVAYSPVDPSLLASASADGHIRIWEVQHGSVRPLWTFKAHTDHVTSVDWSPTEPLTFASVGWDRKFRVWRIDAEESKACRGPDHRCSSTIAPQLFRKHPQLVWKVAFSPDGTTIAACHGAVGQSPTVIVYNATTGKVLRRLGRHKDTPLTIAWAPSGTLLASAGMDRHMLVYDATMTADDLPQGDPDNIEEQLLWKLDLKNYLAGLDPSNLTSILSLGRSGDENRSESAPIPHPMSRVGVIL